MSNSLTKYNMVGKPGDFVEFKKFISTGVDKNHEYVICRGKVIDTDKDMLGVDINFDTNTNKKKDLFWINKSSVITCYFKNLINGLTLLSMLQRFWKRFIFREVKTVKTEKPFLVSIQYINSHKFIRHKEFDNLDNAFNKIHPNQHKNIRVHYNNYFGFTTDKIFGSNDKYSGGEIFFSKKCYGELILEGDNITAKFNHNRGVNSVLPVEKQIICGIVGEGDKGLFYRKWFPCSKEFYILWNIVCNPSDDLNMNEIIESLSTKKYKPCNNDNIENNAIYSPDIYQKIARAVYNIDTELTNDTELTGLYPNYETRIRNDVLWMKK